MKNFDGLLREDTATHEIPESLEGPYGYVDDTWLCTYVAERLRGELGDEILERNWEGEAPLLPLLADILARENELLGDKRNLILKYIGYEYLL